MKIVALKYGESVFGENYIFKGGKKVYYERLCSSYDR